MADLNTSLGAGFKQILYDWRNPAYMVQKEVCCFTGRSSYGILSINDCIAFAIKSITSFRK